MLTATSSSASPSASSAAPAPVPDTASSPASDTQTDCRICLIRDTLENTDLKQAIQTALRALREEDKTDKATYESRLSSCLACPHLLTGTCVKCGCYVEIRAAAKQAHCPLKPPRW